MRLVWGPGGAPATQNGREKAAPNKDPAAIAETVHAAMAPFQTTAKEALLARSASNRRPRGMSISSVSPRALTLALAPGGSPPDLPARAHSSHRLGAQQADYWDLSCG